MQKIVIRNFGSIKEAEIAIPKALVLIGEQASGKSTIAKLIHFFKSWKNEEVNYLYNAWQFDSKDEINGLSLVSNLLIRFSTEFNIYSFQKDFEILFYYNVEKQKYVKLFYDKVSQVDIRTGEGFDFDGLTNSVVSLANLISEPTNKEDMIAIQAFNQDKVRFRADLAKLLGDFLETKEEDNLFIIAGRNATVGYSETFEKYLVKTITEKFQNKTLDEKLMLKFMERVVFLKDVFRKYKLFERFMLFSKEMGAKYLLEIKEKTENILRGEYVIDNLNEQIVFNKKLKESVALANSSSGQQEVIRILQDIFFTIVFNTKSLRIVEEPEAHLFPTAQKLLIELLVQMANYNDFNQLIITTHSPYVLTVFNNLLFAQRVIDKNPSMEAEVQKVISQEARLKANDFAAYSLNIEDGGKTIAKSIVNKKTGMIEQNYLDTASEILNNDFEALYTLHAKTFAR